MKKNNYIFPAVIEVLGQEDFNVRFPDFENINTYGESLSEAFDMAEDALKLEIFDLFMDSNDIPDPTDINNIKLGEKESLILVKINLSDLIREYEDKSVKKTLTIPSWMADKGEKEKVNFSQVLQEALRSKFGV